MSFERFLQARVDVDYSNMVMIDRESKVAPSGQVVERVAQMDYKYSLGMTREKVSEEALILCV